MPEGEVCGFALHLGLRPWGMLPAFAYCFIGILWFLTMARNWNTVVKIFKIFENHLGRFRVLSSRNLR